MLCKYYLQLGTDTVDTSSADCMDVSAMIKNLDSIKVSYKRVDFGGVVRKCGSTIEFTGKAYDAIVAHYAENYLQSSGVFAVYIADNNWNYTKAWECPLDFATLQYDANVLSIGCVDNSAAAIIKANKKSKYEFNVSDLKDANDLLYNGVRTQEDFTFSVVGAAADGTTMKSTGNVGNPQAIYSTQNKEKYSCYFPSVGAVQGDDPVVGFELRSQEEYASIQIASGRTSMMNVFDYTKHGFIKCTADGIISLDFNISFWFADPTKLQGYTVKFILLSYYCGTGRAAGYIYNLATLPASGTMELNVHKEISMQYNRELAFGVLLSTTRNDENTFDLGMRWGSNVNIGAAIHNNYENNPIHINVVKPKSLLDGILDKMFVDTNCHCVTKIEEDENYILPKTLLVAAESFRRISANKIYSSFQNFCDFMEVVFGYIYTLKDIGYYMDNELRELDSQDRTTISHIRPELLTSQTMNPVSTHPYYKMLPVGGFIDEDVEDALDLTTPFNYQLTSGDYNSYLENILYDSIHNVFVVWDATTQKYYANFTMEDAIMQGDWYNENGHAKEMIGLNFATFHEEAGYHLYGIIRNGALVLCDDYHTKDWLESSENSSICCELSFKHRNKVFTPEVIKTLLHVNNLSYEFDDSLAFSDVEVGYAKVDYDNGNAAKDEFNFTNYYKTKNNISDQTLSLICPYRADCFGTIEVLNKNTNNESDKSDNDIFIVIASGDAPNGEYWEIDRSVTIQNVISPETMFNAAIAPNRIVRNNEEYIGACANMLVASNLLKFTSSDGNSNALIGGQSMHANINITKQLFKAGKINIDTDDHKFPTDWEGVIEFVYAGKTYQGFLEGIDICFANLGTITYNLIEKCIE